MFNFNIVSTTLQTLINGATYNGSVKHSLINYTLIIFSLLPFIIAGNKKERSKSHWFTALLTAIVLQVALWFLVNATGVSVIWSLMYGFGLIFLLRHHLTGITVWLFIIGLLMGLFGIIYYAITLPFITTAAHLVAVLTGIGLYFLLRRVG